jgi:hypothetical protein
MKKRPTVRVGVMGSKASEAKSVRGGGGSETTVIDVATKHEFGIGVPRRSFIADWADESEAEARRRLRKAADRIEDQGGLELELNKFGIWAVGQIQARISRRIPPPLSETRIAQKGSDVPLIDTGQLRSSVTYDVDDG